MPKVNVNLSREVIKKTWNEAFIPILKLKEPRYQVFRGGASSGKSSAIFARAVLEMLEGRNQLIIRKVFKTHKHSTFAEMKNVISRYKGLSELFTINKTTLTITCINGAEAVFEGLDNVEKLKSLKASHGIWDTVIIEEAPETTEEEFDLVCLRQRGKSKHGPVKTVLLLNPVSARCWIKKRFFDVQKPNVYTHLSTYKDNRYLSEEDHEFFKELKEKNPELYKIYALNQWGDVGVRVFNNFTVKSFDYSNFDKRRLGIDWGFNEPAAVLDVAMHDGDLYVCRGFAIRRLTNEELIREVKEQIGQDIYTIADSAEPARIKQFNQKGIKTAGVVKTKGFKEGIVDWIKQRHIFIHPSCVDLITEIDSWGYVKDKHGNLTDRLSDAYNHSIDALIYAVQEWSTNKPPVEITPVGERVFGGGGRVY